MSFVISQTKSFRWPVTIAHLREDGSTQRHKVYFRFRRLDADELLDYEQRDADLARFAEAVERANGDRDMAMILMAADEQSAGRAARRSADKARELMDILEGWEDVADADGPLEFDQANLEALLRSEPTAYPAIKAAFREANAGDQGKRKN